MFKGTSNPSGDAGVTAGLVPASYETGEIAGITYDSLDQTDWTGASVGGDFGDQLTTVDMGVQCLVVSAGAEDSNPITFYSYDSVADTMPKRALIPGSSDGHAMQIRGGTVAGTANLIILNKSGYDTIRIK